MGSDSLTFEQFRLIFVLYFSSIIPLLLLIYLRVNNFISKSLVKFYFLIFAICALGWELWFTYGIIDGFPVDMRRADILNFYIPKNLNWILNSLADAGAITFGSIFLTWLILKKDNAFLYKWSWKAFAILLLLFITQNILVEMFLYHDQLSVGREISWAPFSPWSPYYNPILFSFNDRTIMFQTQLPWLFIAPVIYRLFIYSINKND